MQEPIDEVILEQIRESVGTLDDLPLELANTVANVYYRYYEGMGGGMDGLMDRFFLGGPESFANDQAQTVADTKMVVGLAENLASIDKLQRPNLYQYTVELALDILKYRISNVHQKTGFRRMIERRLKRGKVNEIPNLIEVLREWQREPQTLTELMERYQLAAEQGDPIAQYNLGSAYHHPEQFEDSDTPPDYGEAAMWYRLAAKHGHAESQYCLGKMFNLGEGLAQDSTEALKWHRLAARQGHIGAQHFLGGAYRLGIGTGQDYVKSAAWSRLAAEQGHPPAQFDYGFMYERGRPFTRDPVQALMWLILSVAGARRSGRSDARYVGGSSEIAAKLRSDQISEAEQLAREWSLKTWEELQPDIPEN